LNIIINVEFELIVTKPANNQGNVYRRRARSVLGSRRQCLSKSEHIA